MKQTLTIVVFASLALLGCKKKEGEKQPGASKPVPATAEPSAAEPAPTPPPAAAPAAPAEDMTTGIAECDALAKQVAACPGLHPDAKAALLGRVMAAKAQKDATEDMKKSMGQICAEAGAAQADKLKAAGC
jgi:hypothetical protein